MFLPFFLYHAVWLNVALRVLIQGVQSICLSTYIFEDINIYLQTLTCLSFLCSLFSGKRWVAMMMPWTPSGRTKSAMYVSSTRITGYAVTSSLERTCCVYMWRWNSQCAIATAFPTSQVPAKRPSTSSTMSLTRTQPQPPALSGWRTLMWRWTLLPQMRAFPCLSLGG